MTSPPASPIHEVSSVDLLVVLTRVEVKLDGMKTAIDDHEQRIRAIEQHGVLQTDIAPVVTDVAGLKRRQWPLPSVAALTGISALITASWPHLGH